MGRDKQSGISGGTLGSMICLLLFVCLVGLPLYTICFFSHVSHPFPMTVFPASGFPKGRREPFPLYVLLTVTWGQIIPIHFTACHLSVVKLGGGTIENRRKSLCPFLCECYNILLHNQLILMRLYFVIQM